MVYTNDTYGWGFIFQENFIESSSKEERESNE